MSVYMEHIWGYDGTTRHLEAYIMTICYEDGSWDDICRNYGSETKFTRHGVANDTMEGLRYCFAQDQRRSFAISLITDQAG